jgi:hypothetical protein
MARDWRAGLRLGTRRTTPRRADQRRPTQPSQHHHGNIERRVSALLGETAEGRDGATVLTQQPLDHAAVRCELSTVSFDKVDGGLRLVGCVEKKKKPQAVLVLNPQTAKLEPAALATLRVQSLRRSRQPRNFYLQRNILRLHVQRR